MLLGMRKSMGTSVIMSIINELASDPYLSRKYMVKFIEKNKHKKEYKELLRDIYIDHRFALPTSATVDRVYFIMIASGLFKRDNNTQRWAVADKKALKDALIDHIGEDDYRLCTYMAHDIDNMIYEEHRRLL